MLSMIVIIIFLLFQVVIAMNVIPVYITDQNVKKIMQELPNDPNSRGLSPRELKIQIAKKLRMNSVNGIKTDNIAIKAGRGVNIVSIDYEPRGKLIGNLDFIVSFSHEAEVASR